MDILISKNILCNALYDFKGGEKKQDDKKKNA